MTREAEKDLDNYLLEDLKRHDCWAIERVRPGAFICTRWEDTFLDYQQGHKTTAESVAGDIRAYIVDVLGFTFDVRADYARKPRGEVWIYCPWENLHSLIDEYRQAATGAGGAA